MKATVAICTWNRSRLLAATLEALSQSAVGHGFEWEVLVIDNGSTDATRKVLSTYSTRLPLRSVLESRMGLSNARNAAIGEARGEFILWTDDDVLVDPEWVSNYAEAFESEPDVAFFGGPVRPWFENQPPEWIEAGIRALPGAFALVDHGPDRIALSKETLPWGANFAIRTDVQKGFPYDPNLGRHGTSLRSGEETAVMEALLDAGFEGRWIPEAMVSHLIPEERQKVGFLRGRIFAHGKQLAAIDTSRCPRLFGRPRWVWKAAILEELKYRTRRFVSPPEVWIRHLGRAAQAQGMILGTYPDQEAPWGTKG